MKCYNCKHTIKGFYNFCPNCGTKQDDLLSNKSGNEVLIVVRKKRTSTKLVGNSH